MTAASAAKLTLLRRLSGRRAARADTGRFVLDGPTLLGEALAAGLVVEDVFVEPGAGSPAAVATARAAGVRVHEVPDATLRRVTDTVTPQGVAAIAVARLGDEDAAVAAAAAGPLALVLAGVADPGNAGTLVRVAEACGAGVVVFCEGAVDPTGPKCVRASAGALFHVPVCRSGPAGPLLDRLAAAGVARVGTVVRGGVDCDRADLSGPIALVMGNEAHGMEASLRARLDLPVSIPMVGRSESLNVAMAGAIVCYEALRQRRNRLEPAGPEGGGFPAP
ncbi:MAG: TrmH family RNA methyltransferase [Acidimicrobiia bacterium]